MIALWIEPVVGSDLGKIFGYCGSKAPTFPSKSLKIGYQPQFWNRYFFLPTSISGNVESGSKAIKRKKLIKPVSYNLVFNRFPALIPIVYLSIC